MPEEKLLTIAHQRFWKRVLRFAYARLKRSPGRMPDGVPGIRDVDHPCSVFLPLKPGEERDRFGQCMTDGHYLCRECVYMSPEALAERDGEEEE